MTLTHDSGNETLALKVHLHLYTKLPKSTLQITNVPKQDQTSQFHFLSLDSFH